MIHQTEKQLDELKDKLSKEDSESINNKVEELKKAKETNDKDAISASIENLNKVFSAVSEKLYKDAQENAPDPNADAGASPNKENADEVKDVDYEVVDEEGDKK